MKDIRGLNFEGQLIFPLDNFEGHIFSHSTISAVAGYVALAHPAPANLLGGGLRNRGQLTGRLYRGHSASQVRSEDMDSCVDYNWPSPQRALWRGSTGRTMYIFIKILKQFTNGAFSASR